MNSKYGKKISLINTSFWLIWPLALVSMLTFMFITCGNKTNNKEELNAESDASHVPVPLGNTLKEFPMVEIPALLIDAEARADYLAIHYWDRFDFSDTILIHLPELIEQGFANYLSVLPHTTLQIASSSIKQMLTESQAKDKTGKMYVYFLDQYKSYLYNPNSPFRNDDYYIAVTEYILSDSFSDEDTKERAQFDLKLMLKNRVGTKATDFSYLTIDQKQGTLHTLKKEYTLLYFNDPDCSACKETTVYLENSPLIHHLLKKEILDILVVYSDDDLSLWQTHRKDIPTLWINARDERQVLKNKLVYDLKATPCLYLLDRNKKVLLKDADVKAVEAFLNTRDNKENKENDRL